MPYIKKKTSTIKRDHLGLYVMGSNLLARPVYGTVFAEGTEVKAHYMLNQMRVGQVDQPSISAEGALYELWQTSFITAHAYENQKITDTAFIFRHPTGSFKDYLDYEYAQRQKNAPQWAYKHEGFNNLMAPMLRKHIRSQRLDKFLGNEESSL